MPKGFQNGNKGKPKGVKHKKTLQWEALSESLTGDQSDKFSMLMNKLWDGTIQEQLQAAELYIKMVEYFKPKQSRVINNQENEMIIKVIRK